MPPQTGRETDTCRSCVPENRFGVVGIVVLGPAGVVIDRIGARRVVVASLPVQIAAYVVLASATTVARAALAMLMLEVAVYLIDAASFLAPLAILLGPLRHDPGRAPPPGPHLRSGGDPLSAHPPRHGQRPRPRPSARARQRTDEPLVAAPLRRRATHRGFLIGRGWGGAYIGMLVAGCGFVALLSLFTERRIPFQVNGFRPGGLRAATSRREHSAGQGREWLPPEAANRHTHSDDETRRLTAAQDTEEKTA